MWKIHTLQDDEWSDPHFIAGEFQGSVLVDQQDTKTMDVGRLQEKWDMFTRILRIRS